MGRPVLRSDSRRALRTAASLAATLLLAACGTAVEATQNATVAVPAETAAAAGDVPLPATVLADIDAVAEHYQRWSRIDDQMRWAPELCMLPPAPRARLSKSRDEQTHGRKLYSIFALHPEPYAGFPATHHFYTDSSRIDLSTEFEQVLVKEAWTPRVLAGDETDPENREVLDPLGPGLRRGIEPAHLRPAQKDGQTYVPEDFAGLYLMLKLDDATPGTDEGWVYATVGPDKQVTAAGRIASCMECHVDAPHGRLFGLPDAKHPPRPATMLDVGDSLEKPGEKTGETPVAEPFEGPVRDR